MSKKEVIEKVKKEINEYVSDQSFSNYLEDDTSSTIVINLSEGNIFDEYSGESLLCEDIYKYTENTFKLVDKRREVNIKFDFSKEYSKETIDKVKKAFKTHYAVELLQSRKQLFRTRLISIILLLVGVIFLVVYGLLSLFNADFIFQNVMEIVSWVFIWEATNQFFFQNMSNKRTMLKNLILFNAKIID